MSDDAIQGRKLPRPPFVAVLISIFPPPVRAGDEFTLTAISATEGYSADTPIVVGQYPLHDAQSLTIHLRIQPAPPPILRVPPRFADGWPEEPAEFAAALREARQKTGLSQSRLAWLAGYSEMTVRNIETNRYAANAEARRRFIESLANARKRNISPTEAPRSTDPNPSTPDAVPTQEKKKDEP